MRLVEGLSATHHPLGRGQRERWCSWPVLCCSVADFHQYVSSPMKKNKPVKFQFLLIVCIILGFLQYCENFSSLSLSLFINCYQSMLEASSTHAFSLLL